ncbi:alpha/beta fold hydrolase [Aquimarina sp. RZ0]|uniref:alpha/beta fold hydrolase n=1 Tax=Aquimarina sp. RZ0 TaxID=2607730 RepID=UPI0011F0B87E|nr:alpha/beta hydrolase [Aquimarina sp. RZ0]KAA1246074.1 alpha/beta hydrolase [Aquimarina sp. RZ0]
MKNLKLGIRLLEKISPRITAKIIFNYISNPRTKKFRPFEKQIIEEAQRSSINFKGFNIAVYKWGEGKKKALLIHGWEGRASNFGAIIPKLLEYGYQVISYDAPSHGNSTKKKTNFFDIPKLIEVFLKKEQYDLVMTHSGGSVMSLLIMNNLKYSGDKMVLLTVHDKFEDYIEHIIQYFGLTIRTKTAFMNLVRKITPYEPLDLQASLFVRNIAIKKAIFIHDEEDKIVSVANSKYVSSKMPGSKFFEVKGTGHFKMLWSPKVINIIEEQVLKD